MEEYGAALKSFVETTGPVGAIIAAVIVGAGLLVIVFARTAGLFNTTRGEHQKGDFVGQLLTRVEALEAREVELYRDLERNEADHERLKDRHRELQTQVALMRNQLRHVIDKLRAVREGRLAPEAIEVADTIEIPS